VRCRRRGGRRGRLLPAAQRLRGRVIGLYPICVQRTLTGPESR
jgi:hypothetical protein